MRSGGTLRICAEEWVVIFSAKVLVVDDDGELRDLLKDVMEEASYQVLFAADPEEAFRTFFQEQPDLVILDILLPEMSGWEVLRRMRGMAETPIIILSALAGVEERVRGLKAGADDYLPKPFSPGELIARCNALLRRNASNLGPEPVVYKDSSVRIDFQQHTVYADGGEVALSPTEFRLLGVLVRHAGMLLEADQLIDMVWGLGSGSRESLRLYIGYLRKKLRDDASRPRLIETVPGVGYRYKRLRDVSTDLAGS